jgi:signal transduction histidine kinase
MQVAVQSPSPSEGRPLEDALRRLADLCATERDAERIADALLAVLAEVLAPHRLALYLPHGDGLRLAAGRGPAGLPDRVALTFGAIGAAARTRAIQLVDDVRRPPPDLAGGLAPDALGDTRSLLGLPLLASGEIAGVVAATWLEARTFGPDEREQLRRLASLAGLALDAARARTTAARLEAQVDLVVRASLAISDTLAILPEPHLQAALQRGFLTWPHGRERRIPELLRAVLQSIVEHARVAVGAELAALGVGDDPTRPFDPWVFAGVSAETARALGRHPRPVATLGLVARDGLVVRVPDVTKHPAHAGLPPGHPPVRSLLGVPIRYRSVTLGNLYLCNKIGAEEFSAEDERALALLASHAALALQQAYLRASLGTQRAETQILLDAAPHGILFVDADAGTLIANPRAIELLGRVLVPSGGLSQLVGLVHHPDGRPLDLEELPARRALAGETVAARELLIVQPGGRRLPVLLSAAPVRTLGDEIAGAVAIFEDISALRELDRLREEFAAVVAHDLRTPIQAILLQTQILARDAEGESVRVPLSAVQRIERSAKRLDRMAGDLLEATRLDLRRLALDLKPVAPGAAAAALVDRIRPALGAHPVTVEVAGEPAPVRVDPVRLDQILTNLIENAAKYSPERAPIVVRVAAAGAGVEVAVHDEGPGIAAEEIPRLFERYYQSQRARARQSGLGLGLYITKGLVEALAGRITVDSTPGQGSTFRVWLPAADADAAPRA